MKTLIKVILSTLITGNIVYGQTITAVDSKNIEITTTNTVTVPVSSLQIQCTSAQNRIIQDQERASKICDQLSQAQSAVKAIK